MKTLLLSFAAAVALMATTQSFAASAPASDYHDNDRRERSYKEDRKAVGLVERARYEAAKRKIELERQRREAAERARWEAQHRNDRDFNYGYDRNHRVTPSERARWEAAHRNDYGRR